MPGNKVPDDEVVNQIITGHFIRSRAMEMIVRSEEEVELTQWMDIKRRKADNQLDGMRNREPRPRSELLGPPRPLRPRRSVRATRTSGLARTARASGPPVPTRRRRLARIAAKRA